MTAVTNLSVDHGSTDLSELAVAHPHSHHVRFYEADAPSPLRWQPSSEMAYWQAIPSLLRKLRSAAPGVKVMVLSGHSDKAREVKAAGAAMFVPKTTPAKALLGHVATMLDTRRPPRCHEGSKP